MAKQEAVDDELKQFERRFKALQRSLIDLPWILQGTVVTRQPPTGSSTAKPAYRWTRKVRGKTVNASLSKQQAIAFRRAIKANRELEETLQEMRELSHSALLSCLPGPKRKSAQELTKRDHRKPS